MTRQRRDLQGVDGFLLKVADSKPREICFA
jgi:hypothetical protein